MWGSAKYNLSHLTDFSGRDARQTFWFYAAFLVFIAFVLGLVAAVPMRGSMMGTAYDAARAGADPVQVQAAMVTGMAGSMRTQMLISSVLSVIMALLLVAAFVRRLHDAGFTGWIAVIPIAAQAFSSFFTYSKLDEIMALIE